MYAGPLPWQPSLLDVGRDDYFGHSHVGCLNVATSPFLGSVAHTLTISSGPSGSPNPVASGRSVLLSVTAVDSLSSAISLGWTGSCPGLPSSGAFNNPNAQNPTWTAPSNTTGSPRTCTIQ